VDNRGFVKGGALKGHGYCGWLNTKPSVTVGFMFGDVLIVLGAPEGGGRRGLEGQFPMLR